MAAIAWLLCLGFGNLGTQVVSNSRLAKVMPENIQTAVCEPLIASALTESNCFDTPAVDVAEPESVEDEEQSSWYVEEALDNILENQVVIYNQMNESFAALQQMINDLTARYSASSSEEVVVDERAQQRLQLQAQIEALQAEMTNL